MVSHFKRPLSQTGDPRSDLHLDAVRDLRIAEAGDVHRTKQLGACEESDCSRGVSCSYQPEK